MASAWSRLLSRFSASEEQNRFKPLLGFKPNKIELYEIAFRHSSVNGPKLNNQRLEFLGDAILGAVVAEYLYSKLPGKNEGYLTQMRSKIVSRSMLNDISYKLRIQSYIETRGRKPKQGDAILGDALEALIGAIYMDKGYNVARKFVLEQVVQPFTNLSELENLTISYKGSLLEWAQKQKNHVRLETLMLESGTVKAGFECKVFVNDELMGVGIGRSKKRAEERASLQTCSKLELK